MFHFKKKCLILFPFYLLQESCAALELSDSILLSPIRTDATVYSLLLQTKTNARSIFPIIRYIFVSLCDNDKMISKLCIRIRMRVCFFLVLSIIDKQQKYTLKPRMTQYCM